MASMSSLPLELVEDIFYRTPIESLARFRTTSKEWYAFFNDKRFIYEHLDLSQERFIRIDEGYKSFRLFNPENKARLCLPDELRSQVFDKTIHCDGLLLCHCTHERERPAIRKLAVWNPILSQVKWIEPSKSYEISDIFGFGYDNVSRDNYKIVRFNRGNYSEIIEIYEFKSKLWRRVDATLECNAMWYPVSMNGNMYWIAERSFAKPFIQSFDFSTERFKPICCVPEETGHFQCDDPTVRVSGFGGDRLSLLRHRQNVKFEVWVTSKLTDGVVSLTKYLHLTPGPPILHYRSYSRIFSTYFIHKTNKIMFFCEDVSDYNGNCYTSVYEMREDGMEKQVEINEGGYSHHICNVYVPSLVPVPDLEKLGSEKPVAKKRSQKKRGRRQKKVRRKRR